LIKTAKSFSHPSKTFIRPGGGKTPCAFILGMTATSTANIAAKRRTKRNSRAIFCGPGGNGSPYISRWIAFSASGHDRIPKDTGTYTPGGTSHGDGITRFYPPQNGQKFSWHDCPDRLGTDMRKQVVFHLAQHIGGMSR
jgi:hypothetical protein